MDKSFLNIHQSLRNHMSLPHSCNPLIFAPHQVYPFATGMRYDIEGFFLCEELFVVSDAVWFFAVWHFYYFEPFFYGFDAARVDVFYSIYLCG